MRTESFRPSLHGFRFQNACGAAGTAFGLGAPLLPAFGLGAGMVWAALDRYLAGRPVPADVEVPPATDALHAELVLRQSNALGEAPWSRLVEWQCLPERGSRGHPGLCELSRAHWRRARRSLDEGVPIMLFLVLADGRHANPSLNRAVLAVGYEADSSAGRATLLVYDPDRPGTDNVRLAFRTGRRDPLDARLAAETQVRGFFTVPYDRAVPAALTVNAVRAADAGPIDSVIGIMGGHQADGPLQVLAREHHGGLLYLRRDRRGEWAADELPRAAGTPSAAETESIALVGAGRILARTSQGDLIEIHRRPALGWSARNITQSRRIGDGFRIDDGPAILNGRDGVTAMGCRRGRLVRYRCSTLRSWKAELVTSGTIGAVNFVGRPALIEQDGLHVLCRSDSGDLIHLREDRKAGWVACSTTIRQGGRARFVVGDDPIVLADPTGKVLNAVVRARDGSVLLFRWTERGWNGLDLTMSARTAGSDLPPADSRLSAAVDEDGTVHVAARAPEGGLLHFWCTRSGAAGGAELTGTRSVIGADNRIDGAPVLGAGRDGALHVLARQGTSLLLFRWTPVGDWSVENVSHEQHTSGMLVLMGEPVMSCVASALHIALVDVAGRLYHACLAAGRPKRAAGSAEAGTVAHPRPSAAPARMREAPAPRVAAPPAPPPPAEPLAAPATSLPPLQPATAPVPPSMPAAGPPRLRSVPPTNHPGRPVLPPTRRPAAISPANRDLPGLLPPAPPAVAASTPHAATNGTKPAAPPPPPAIDGLPLLSEESPPQKQAADVPHEPAKPAKRRVRNDGLEMQRLMALADEETPKLIKPN